MTPVWNKGFLPANLESKAEKKNHCGCYPSVKMRKTCRSDRHPLACTLGRDDYSPASFPGHDSISSHSAPWWTETVHAQLKSSTSSHCLCLARQDFWNPKDHSAIAHIKVGLLVIFRPKFSRLMVPVAVRKITADVIGPQNVCVLSVRHHGEYRIQCFGTLHTLVI